MAVTVRLTRLGTTKAPYYRIVVADQRKKRDGRYLERIGLYDPRITPEAITLDETRLAYWVSKGAQVSETVAHLTKRHVERKAKAPAPAAK
jgi:small subunit ribosomal protein S16